MNRRKSLYTLTDGDKAIFAAARAENNPNRILNYYLRNEDSGTWWRHVADKDVQSLEMPENIAAALRWQEGYNVLHDIWKHLRKPDFFAPTVLDSDDWRPITGDEYEARRERLERIYRVTWEDTEFPVFHHPHGAILLPWQLDMHRSNHPTQVVPGGLGSGKTLAKALSMATRAITLPGYRGFALAPFGIQAAEVHKLILQMLEGTLFADRFLVGAPTKPNPQLIFGHKGIGQTTIECYSVLDDPGKILTLTGDEALVDQAEQIPDIDDLMRIVSSRFRGMVRGRPRRGQIALVANSADNPMLWDWFDEGAVPNDDVWSYAPATYENFYLTIADLKRFEKQVAKDETSRRMYFKGERPIGSGEHFPAASLVKCRADWLDELMNKHLAAGTVGWVKQEAKRVAVHHWEKPYEDGHRYIVAADPGWGNPPMRNAAAIGVWDITDFPHVPAILVAFDWTFGNGSPNPWIAQYIEFCLKFKAIGFNGFDSTGLQSGYERTEEIKPLLATPVALGGQNKYVYLTLTKKFMADGKFQVPPSIVHLFSQCSKYRLPDEKLRQDIVMMLLVTSALLEPYNYLPEEQEAPDNTYDMDDRYDRRFDRDADFHSDR